MKQIKTYILALVGGTCMLCSCNDFLDVNPQGELTSDVYFSQEERINEAVSRVYSSINWRFFRLGTMYFTTHEFTSDDIRMNTSDAAFLTAYEFQYDPNNVYVQRLWERWYQYLNDCNQVLELTKKYDDKKAVLYNAQARFFRAYWHFDLLNVFGPVILRDHVPAENEYNIPKSSEEDIYKLVISDLEYAITHLPSRQEWGEENLGRVTKGTAKGILAKVYLYRQDYENAYKYANEIVNVDNEYSLDPDYSNLFSIEGKYSVESMMPGHYIYQNIKGRLRNPYVEFQGIPGSGIGSAYFVPSDEFVASYEAGDLRKKATIFEKGEKIEGYVGEIKWLEKKDESGNVLQEYKYANKKVIRPATEWPDNDFFKQQLNLPFLRFADLLLVYAEAANELNKTVEAERALEKVRFRARGNKTFAEAGVLPEKKGLSKEGLREAIWHERRMELSFEGNRWFDLVRYEKVVPNYTTNLLHSKGRVHFDYAKHSKFPIPSYYVTNSEGVLEQNQQYK